MHILTAQMHDLPAVVGILEEAKQIMRETGNVSQWSDDYPSKAMLQRDIEQQAGFLCMHENQIVGYFCFQQGDNPDPNYHFIENGAWLNDAPYGVIHRLASNRKVKGIAKVVFAYAFSKINNIRVDTHHNNLPLQNFLKKESFEYCGIIYVSDGSPRDAFQKTN